MSIIRILLCMIIGYLLGNIQTGVLVGKLISNIDLRLHGSGSSGATNALRVLGRQSALLTLVGDCLKGVLAVLFGLIIGGRNGGMIAAIAVVVGHIWPVFFGFKGGKGVATCIGVLLCLTPFHALIVIALGVGLLYFTKMVSLASISAAILYFILSMISAIATGSWIQFFFGLVMACMVIFAHRENILRLRNGTEGRITKEMFERK